MHSVRSSHPTTSVALALALRSALPMATRVPITLPKPTPILVPMFTSLRLSTTVCAQTSTSNPKQTIVHRRQRAWWMMCLRATHAEDLEA